MRDFYFMALVAILSSPVPGLLAPVRWRIVCRLGNTTEMKRTGVALIRVVASATSAVRVGYVPAGQEKIVAERRVAVSGLFAKPSPVRPTYKKYMDELQKIAQYIQEIKNRNARVPARHC